MAESTRFLILSRGRTGSTFLQRLLDSHTECICFEELYAPRPVPPSPPKCPADRFAGMLAGADLRDTDPVAFLEQSVHRPIDGIAPAREFIRLVREVARANVRPPFNREARLAAGFDAHELEMLMAMDASTVRDPRGILCVDPDDS